MKEQFIKMVNTKNYDIQWFYKLFTQRIGATIGLQMFSVMLQQHDFNKIVDDTAKSFELTRIFDANGTLVSVY